ncbi:MAG: fused MFS/spermidine synthase [Myxococcota bacterium]
MSTTTHDRAPRINLLLAVFFLSGMAGLIYQVAWSRLLTLVIGVSIFAITTVICTFMTGLALGSHFFGRHAERWRNSFLAYGILEALIGLYAALTPWIFELAQPIYAWAFPHFDRFGLNAFRVLLSMLILLPPTFLMGGTLPLLSRVIGRWSHEAAAGTGVLYAVNTMGAVVGCVLGGFVLLSHLGVRHSLYVAAATNLGIAAAVWLGSRGQQIHETEPAAPRGSQEPLDRTSILVLAVFFLSGFAALGYEVLWTRALLVHLKASTYAFSLMLSVYLLGVALGSAVASGIVARIRNPLNAIAVCQIGIAVTIAAGLYLFPELRQLGMTAIGSRRIDSFARAVAFMSSQAFIVLFPPTVFMGAMFPFGIAAYHRPPQSVAGSVGTLYAVNTAGNIAGSIVIGFFLIAILGVRHSLIALISVNLALAAVLLARPSLSLARRLTVAAVAIATVLMIHLGISQTLFYESITSPQNKIVFYAEGASDTVAVVERPKQRDRTLIYSDGRGAAGTSTLRWNLYLGHLAPLLHPEPKQILHICYGSGNSVLALTRHAPERIDAVELSPHVRDASAFFWTNENVLADSRVNLIIEDGRNFLLGTRRMYDVISLEPPNIYTAGVVNLYTREFYDVARSHLKPGGLMQQWLPTIQLSRSDREMLIRAFADAFPHVTLWQQLRSSTLLLLGSERPLSIDVDDVEERLRSRGLRNDLKRMGLRNAYGFLSFYLLGDSSVRALVDEYDAVVDDRTVVDFSIPRFVGSGFGFSIFTYVIGDNLRNPTRVVRERMRQYATWGDPASEIVPDPCQARRLDRAIRLRREGRSGDLAASEPVPGCP